MFGESLKNVCKYQLPFEGHASARALRWHAMACTAIAFLCHWHAIATVLQWHCHGNCTMMLPFRQCCGIAIANPRHCDGNAVALPWPRSPATLVPQHFPGSAMALPQRVCSIDMTIPWQRYYHGSTRDTRAMTVIHLTSIPGDWRFFSMLASMIMRETCAHHLTETPNEMKAPQPSMKSIANKQNNNTEDTPKRIRTNNNPKPTGAHKNQRNATETTTCRGYL